MATPKPNTHVPDPEQYMKKVYVPNTEWMKWTKKQRAAHLKAVGSGWDNAYKEFYHGSKRIPLSILAGMSPECRKDHKAWKKKARKAAKGSQGKKKESKKKMKSMKQGKQAAMKAAERAAETERQSDIRADTTAIATGQPALAQPIISAAPEVKVKVEPADHPAPLEEIQISNELVKVERANHANVPPIKIEQVGP